MSNRLYDEDKVIRRTVLKNFSNSRLPLEDLYQIGWVGYLKAIKNFNPEVSERMTLKYATMYINNEINTALNGKERVPSVEYIDEMHHEAMNGPPEAEIEDREAKKTLRKHIGSLEEVQQAVIRKRFLVNEPQTHQEIADELGLGSRQRAFQIESAAIAQLRRLYSEDPNA